MKIPASFDYVKVGSLREFFELQRSARSPFVIAGGTVGVLMLKNRAVRPDLVIDISGIEELSGVRVDERRGEVFVGPNVRLHELPALLPDDAASELLRASASGVGDVAIRSVGTVGGNVCLGDPSNDLPVALTALGAVLEITGESGRREVPASEFYLGPFRTALRRGELLTGIRYRIMRGYRSSYRKHFIRFLDHYVGMVAAIGRRTEGGIELSAAIAGQAAGTPRALPRRLFSDLGDLQQEVERLIGSVEMRDDRFGTASYKRKVLRVLFARAIEEVVGQ
ncbi:MAG: FAD binding domain-containing protein [Nitrososphaeria archaeon]